MSKHKILYLIIRSRVEGEGKQFLQRKVKLHSSAARSYLSLCPSLVQREILAGIRLSHFVQCSLYLFFFLPFVFRRQTDYRSLSYSIVKNMSILHRHCWCSSSVHLGARARERTTTTLFHVVSSSSSSSRISRLANMFCLFVSTTTTTTAAVVVVVAWMINRRRRRRRARARKECIEMM